MGRPRGQSEFRNSQQFRQVRGQKEMVGRLAGSDHPRPHPHITMPKEGFKQKPDTVRFLFNNDSSGCQVGRRGIMYRRGIPEGFLEEVTGGGDVQVELRERRLSVGLGRSERRVGSSRGEI